MSNKDLFDFFNGKVHFVESELEMGESGEEEYVSEQALSNILLIDSATQVIFPRIVSSINVKDSKIIEKIKEYKEENKQIGVFLRKKKSKKRVCLEDLHKIGTLIKILKILPLPDGSAAIILYGKSKIKLKDLVDDKSYIQASVEIFPDKQSGSIKNEELVIDSLRETTSKLLSFSNDAPLDLKVILEEIKSVNFLVYFLASNMDISLDRKQNLLEITVLETRAKRLLKYLLEALDFAKVKKAIQSKVHTDLTQTQKEQFLRYHIKALQEELGDFDYQEINDLEEVSKKKNWPKHAEDAFNRSLNKLKRLTTSSPEYGINIDYAETLLELPWNDVNEDKLNIKNAENILNRDHFGLGEVKERILEYLAVCKLKKNQKAPIICLCGPPGVGKTSLGKSIADALGRDFVKIALGGVSDEAEIRGHRKTYIGASTGKIISAFKHISSSNPLFVLDEIDKLSNLKGDPAAALLEVLDPEQNSKFVDHYLEIPYDLSNVMFIATANKLDISKPLLDRMEVIEISGYILEEKIEIAKKYLIPNQKKNHGLKSTDFIVPDATIAKIIDSYTMESGVRELKRKIAAICRKVAKFKTTEIKYTKTIKEDKLYDLLGLETSEKDLYNGIETPGVSIGLAWTSVGGDILVIETTLYNGSGKIKISGQLGDVMKESVETAYSYIKAKAHTLSIEEEVFSKKDLHVHFPAGGVPKDGPSAGITILAALASLYTKRKVKNKFAMTGEATLRGKVLPVGGIKEKILAAKRVGITNIILCIANKKDVLDINKNYIEGMNFFYVDKMDQVLDLALEQ